MLSVHGFAQVREVGEHGLLGALTSDLCVGEKEQAHEYACDSSGTYRHRRREKQLAYK